MSIATINASARKVEHIWRMLELVRKEFTVLAYASKSDSQFYAHHISINVQFDEEISEQGASYFRQRLVDGVLWANKDINILLVHDPLDAYSLGKNTLLRTINAECVKGVTEL